jgi:hypothetical protein
VRKIVDFMIFISNITRPSFPPSIQCSFASKPIAFPYPKRPPISPTIPIHPSFFPWSHWSPLPLHRPIFFNHPQTTLAFSASRKPSRSSREATEAVAFADDPVVLRHAVGCQARNGEGVEARLGDVEVAIVVAESVVGGAPFAHGWGWVL